MAALFVRDPAVAARMHGFPVSHHYPQGLISECGMLGSRDYSALCTAVDAVQYYLDRQPERYREYTWNLARDAAALLSAAFGTPTLSSDDLSATMRMVQLPDAIGSTVAHAEQLRITLRDRFGIETQQALPLARSVAADTPATAIGTTTSGTASSVLCLRISAAEYSTLADFATLRDAILTLAVEAQPQPA